jgi:hypothetical protein
MIYDYGEPRWNDTDRGKQKNSGKKPCPSATLFTINSTWTDLGVTRASTMRGRGLTAWAMAWPTVVYAYFHTCAGTASPPKSHTSTHMHGHWVFKISGGAQFWVANFVGRQCQRIQNAADDKEPVPRTQGTNGVVLVCSNVFSALEFQEYP